MKMRRFKSNPFEVEAVQWYGNEGSASVIRDWVVKHQGLDSEVRTFGGMLHIHYRGESLHINPLDWVVRDSEMELRAMPPEAFDLEYEEVFIGESERYVSVSDREIYISKFRHDGDVQMVNERTGEVKIEPPHHFVGGYRKLDMSRVEKANRHTDFRQELADLINKYQLDEEYGLDAEVLANQTGMFYATMYTIKKEQ